jgi:hypothetical protein
MSCSPASSSLPTIFFTSFRVVCVVALALLLAGCAASGRPWPPPGYDPYHYRCTGNCQAG